MTTDRDREPTEQSASESEPESASDSNPPSRAHSSSHPDPGHEDLELTPVERDALHELQLAVEYVYRAYGDLLAFHHQLGHAMDRFATGEEYLREAGHDERANRLRDECLPSGAVDDRWTYELVEEFTAGFLEEITDFETDVREELADGLEHVTERDHQRRWRERAEGWGR